MEVSHRPCTVLAQMPSTDLDQDYPHQPLGPEPGQHKHAPGPCGGVLKTPASRPSHSCNATPCGSARLVHTLCRTLPHSYNNNSQPLSVVAPLCVSIVHGWHCKYYDVRSTPATILSMLYNCVQAKPGSTTPQAPRQTPWGSASRVSALDCTICPTNCGFM